MKTPKIQRFTFLGIYAEMSSYGISLFYRFHGHGICQYNLVTTF